MYLDYYEKNFTSYQEAAEAAKITGGTISTFTSTNENGQPMTIYSVKYKPLF